MTAATDGDRGAVGVAVDGDLYGYELPSAKRATTSGGTR